MNIVLTGFMASGKTETSKAIAEMSDYKVIDTDDMIVENTKMSINRIFAEYGEARFREIERETIKEAARLDGYVIATGGGVPLDPSNIMELRKNGIIINLSPDFDVIAERVEAAKETRPLLRDRKIEDIERQFEERRKYYANCDYVVRVTDGRTPRSYASEILGLAE